MNPAVDPAAASTSVTAPISEPSVLIAAGGTGGHVYPGLALAGELRRAAPEIRIAFIGTDRGLERSVVPKAGYQLHRIDVIPLSRRPGLSQVQAAVRFLRSVRQTRRIIRDEGAGVVVGMGGYSSLPVIAAARLAHVAAVLHESGAVPGLANRLAAHLTRNVAVAFPSAAGSFPRRTRPRVIGMPLDPDIAGLDRGALREAARSSLDLPAGRATLLVVGGSQGATRLNAAAVGLAGMWRDRGDVCVLVKTGRDHVEEVERQVAEAGGSALTRVIGFIDRMDHAYAAADLTLCRAGAGTVAEVAAAGLPSILVPYPFATGDHQTRNASELARAGAAVVVADAEATADRLAPLLEELLFDRERLDQMSKAAQGMARPGAAAELAAWVLELAGGRGG